MLFCDLSHGCSSEHQMLMVGLILFLQSSVPPIMEPNPRETVEGNRYGRSTDWAKATPQPLPICFELVANLPSIVTVSFGKSRQSEGGSQLSLTAPALAQPNGRRLVFVPVLALPHGSIPPIG